LDITERFVIKISKAKCIDVKLNDPLFKDQKWIKYLNFGHVGYKTAKVIQEGNEKELDKYIINNNLTLSCAEDHSKNYDSKFSKNFVIFTIKINFRF
jgi:hypothetical protein